ncbi:MAG: hypothetical protein AABW72_03375 [archaeon]|mgnify:CR=1 FL=1
MVLRNAKKIRTPKGEAKIRSVKKRSKKARCPICRNFVLGVSRKGSKTERRPSRIFGGLLCNNCSTRIITEAAKVKTGVKASDQIKLEIKKYVEMAINKM